MPVQAPQFLRRAAQFLASGQASGGEIVEWAAQAHQLRRQAFASESLRGPRRQTATQSEALRCEPLRNESGVEHAVLVPSSHADHPVVVIDLASIDVVDFLAAMLLTSEFS